jgi:hypothetical protein
MNEACPLIGTWRLKGAARLDDDGNRHQPSAGWDAPSGYLIYTPDGRMMAILSTGARDAIGYPDIDDAKRIGAHKSMVAYTGMYEFHGDHVLHHVDIAWIPDWQGDIQKRFVDLDGDRLTLTTPFGRRPDGSMARFELQWERAR